MKHFIFILFISLSVSGINAQDIVPTTLWGIRVGGATGNIPIEEVAFNNAGRNFKLATQNTEFSYHIGLFAHFRIGDLVVQPELIFRTTRTDYLLSEFVAVSFIESIRTENYYYIDLPVLAAYKYKALRIQAGPMARFHIDNTTELIGVAEFQSQHRPLDLGFQAGVGLDLGRFIFDLKYEGDFYQVGDHISFAGNEINFSKRPGRFVLSLGFALKQY